MSVQASVRAEGDRAQVLQGPWAAAAAPTPANPRAHITPYDPMNFQTPAEIFQNVMDHEGHVHPAIAIRFLENLERGGFASLADPQALALSRQGFKGLDNEVMLNLYRSVAALNTDATPAHIRAGAVHYMQALDEGLGLTQQFFLENARTSAAFFSPGNASELEARWIEQGYAQEFGCSLGEAMRHAEQHFDLQNDAHSRLLGQFLMANYAQQAGLGRVELEYFAEAPRTNQKGEVTGEARGFQRIDEQGVIHVGMNAQATGFSGPGGIWEFVNTQFHEFRHAQAERLVQRLERGEIQRGDPEYFTARVMQTNMKNNGYIVPAQDHAAYEAQVCEVDARCSGMVAAICAKNTFVDAGVDYPPARQPVAQAPVWVLEPAA